MLSLCNKTKDTNSYLLQGYASVCPLASHGGWGGCSARIPRRIAPWLPLPTYC